MAPLKSSHSNILPNFTLKNAISTRSKSTVIGPKQDGVRSKRKADCSPSKENKNNKRIAFGERNTNIAEIAKNKLIEDKDKKTTAVRKVTTHMKILPSVKTVIRARQNQNEAPHAPGHKVSLKYLNYFLQTSGFIGIKYLKQF